MNNEQGIGQEKDKRRYMLCLNCLCEAKEIALKKSMTLIFDYMTNKGIRKIHEALKDNIQWHNVQTNTYDVCNSCNYKLEHLLIMSNKSDGVTNDI